MKLVDNWKQLAFKAHSMWAQYAAVGLLLTPEALFWGLEYDTNPYLWWTMAIIASVYGIIGRLIKQEVEND